MLSITSSYDRTEIFQKIMQIDYDQQSINQTDEYLSYFSGGFN